MFLPDNVPILCNLPRDLEFADIFFLHDIHFGSELFNEQKWKELKKKIQNNDFAYVCWIGDVMENAIPNSKSDVFTQKYSPAQQKEWAAQELFDLRNKTISVVSGNHEANRTTKTCGLYPLYDICMLAGVDKKYRDTIAYLDIGVGRAKTVFDHHNKVVYKRNVENINCGSFCNFGGYGARGAYRPQSDKMYKLRIFGGEKKMETTGFYV